MKPTRLTLVTLTLCALGFAASGSGVADRSTPTTLFIVRHAEKVGESSDAQLSNVGRARARTLAWMLRDVSFDAVYSTDFARTRGTVAAIAKASRKELSLYSPAPGSLKKELEAKRSGHTVLISGHSNTIPVLLAELGTPIEDEILPGFDDLFIVTIDPSRAATMQRLHYPATTETH